MKLLFSEIYVVFVLLITSIVGFIIIGEFSPFYDKINPSAIRINSVEIIEGSKPPFYNFFFSGGHLYQSNKDQQISEFYNGSIKLIPTSIYWRFPNTVHEQPKFSIRNDSLGNYDLQIFLKNKPNLAIVSLILSPDDFFSYNDGIYIGGIEQDFKSSQLVYPTPWSRPANFYKNLEDNRRVFFTYYNYGTKKTFSSYADAEISGKATRSFPLKSIRLKADKIIDKKRFNLPDFSGELKFKSIVLRNGGNDYTKSLIRDWLIQTLMSQCNVLTSLFQPVILYINGEYWGIHFLQNRLDVDFISRKFGVKEKDICILENWQIDKGNAIYAEPLLQKISQTPINYMEMEKIIDMDDFCTYLAGQFFFANSDWPHNNVKMYIEASPSNGGKWKFAFFDLDYGMAYTGKDAINMDMFIFLKDKKDKLSILFNSFMENRKFRLIFQKKLIDLTTKFCTTTKMKKTLADCSKIIAPEIDDHFNRWRPYENHTCWLNRIDEIQYFIEKRGEVINRQIEKYFE